MIVCGIASIAQEAAIWRTGKSGADKTTLEQELQFAVVKEKYGHLLTDEQLDEVRKSVLALRAYTEPLRAARLTNDVEPFSVFKPYRGDD